MAETAFHGVSAGYSSDWSAALAAGQARVIFHDLQEETNTDTVLRGKGLGIDL